MGGFVLAVMVAACGGGDDHQEGDVIPLPPLIQLEISANKLAYSQQASFTVTGSGLSELDAATVQACDNVELERPLDGAPAIITCTVNATGELVVQLKDKGGAVIAMKSFAVPVPQVTVNTNLGSMVVELNPTAAPLTVNNFLGYVNAGFYNDTLIHRVIAGFVAQGGWLTSAPAVQTGLKAPIVLESSSGLLNVRGSIGMARTSDPDSATSQYFFNLVDNPALDFVSPSQPGYAVFGKIVKGIEFMDEIGKVSTGNRYGLSNVPLSPVVVLSMVQTQ